MHCIITLQNRDAIKMKTFYLIDFENVHNEGLENIDSLSKEDHVHIFSTKNASTIRMDLVFSKGIDIQGHIVPARKQSLDMHLVSYLGNLLGINGQQCSYVIVSKDTDYDNIIKFWKEEGYPNISRKEAIPNNAKLQKKATPQKTSTKVSSNSKTIKRETQVRSFLGQHFKQKIYTDRKEDIINIISNAKTRQQVNNGLMKLYSDGKVVKQIYQTVKPLIKDLPGE